MGYIGDRTANLTVILPHKKPRKTELTLVQQEQNTEHSRQRVCNEHTMKGIKRLRIVKDTLRLSSYDYADYLFLNACALYNFKVKSPLLAYTM